LGEGEAQEFRGRGRLILLGACIGILASVVALVVYVKIWPHQLKSNGMTYQDLVTVILTALAVMIALLGLGVAILAVWGFTTFQKMAQDAARTYVSNDIEKGRLRTHLEALVTAHLNKESEEGGTYRKILEDAADRYALARGQKPSGTGVTSEDEDEGDV
jgi:uncharacterized membrane protein YcjF (UPF0283 family)